MFLLTLHRLPNLQDWPPFIGSMGVTDVELQRTPSEKLQAEANVDEPVITEAIVFKDDIVTVERSLWRGIAMTAICTLSGLIVVSVYCP